MELEKWQALGNDYLIVESERMPWSLTPPRVRLLCDVHYGFGADGVLELKPPPQHRYAAELTIHNPDGSQAELSGNGAREAVLYLHRRDPTLSDRLSIATLAGAIDAQIIDAHTCTLKMGRARTASDDFPGGPADGRATIAAAGLNWTLQHLQVGNPQAAIAVADTEQLAALDLSAIGAAIERHQAFPNRTNVSFYCALDTQTIRARIFERGVGVTSASGTGASGAAIAHFLTVGHSPIRVLLDGGELVVNVDQDLSFTLTGAAEPVYRATATPQLIERLERPSRLSPR